MVAMVDCPTCGRKAPFTPDNKWRPFCSARCKSVDLGAWASERYRISGDTRDDAASSDEGEAAKDRREGPARHG